MLRWLMYHLGYMPIRDVEDLVADVGEKCYEIGRYHRTLDSEVVVTKAMRN